MAERIRVRDAPGALSLLVNFVAIAAVATASIVAVVNMLPRLRPMEPSLAILLFVIIGVGPSALVAWLGTLRRRTTATPVLQIDGAVAEPGETAKQPWVKVTLCEEGIVLYRSQGAGLIRWNRIRSVRADDESKRFEFSLRKSLGKDSFSAPHRFDEVKKMLSEHISVQ